MMLATAACQMHLAFTVTGMNPAKDPSYFVVVHPAYRLKAPCAECDNPGIWLIRLENRQP